MADASALSQGDLEILVARELRKTGIDVTGFHVRRRTPLPDSAGRYELLIETRLVAPPGERAVLIECHNRKAAIDGALVHRFADTVREAKMREGMMVTTSGYTADAVSVAGTLGVPLLAVTDGATAWRSSGWATGPAPVWFPEFVAQRVGLSELGEPRGETLRAGDAGTILDRMHPIPPPEPRGDEAALPPPA